MLTAALALVVSTACSGAKQEKAMEQKGKALVVFFSHAGDNYAVSKGELPEYEGDVDMSQYDTVFIGGPVWWGTYPQVMFTFFKKHRDDLKGKTVIPFTTHEGSGLANCGNDVKKAFPGANVQKGFSIYGHDVRDGKDKVIKWLKELGY